MRSLASGPDRAVSLGQAVDRLPRRWPIATTSVLAVTVAVTMLQFPFPALRLALWRDPDALAAGQWWRLVTALFVQNDLWWQIVRHARGGDTAAPFTRATGVTSTAAIARTASNGPGRVAS